MVFTLGAFFPDEKSRLGANFGEKHWSSVSSWGKSKGISGFPRKLNIIQTRIITTMGKAQVVASGSFTRMDSFLGWNELKIFEMPF